MKVAEAGTPKLTTRKNSTQTSTLRAGSLGFREIAQYSSASLGSFETKTLTIQGQPIGYFLITGVYNGSTNIREEGYKMRDIKIYLEQSYGAPLGRVNHQQSSLQVRTNATTPKRRIGGRIG